MDIDEVTHRHSVVQAEANSKFLKESSGEHQQSFQEGVFGHCHFGVADKKCIPIQFCP